MHLEWVRDDPAYDELSWSTAPDTETENEIEDW
jgi:hypothetical protein